MVSHRVRLFTIRTLIQHPSKQCNQGLFSFTCIFSEYYFYDFNYGQARFIYSECYFYQKLYRKDKIGVDSKSSIKLKTFDNKNSVVFTDNRAKTGQN